jgi:hypothetical protein
MPTISCTEFNERLAEAVERREPADTPVLREHAGTCAECQAAWLDALIVDRALVQWKKPVATEGLTERILAHVAAQSVASLASTAPVTSMTAGASQSTSRPRRRILFAGMALTAAAVCVCAILFVPRPAQVPQVAENPPQVVPIPRTAEHAQSAVLAQTTVPKQKSPPASDTPVELLVADAGSAYLHLAGDAAKAVTGASVLVPSADENGYSADTPKEEKRWVDDMRQEIAPVTHQLSHAFEFLIDAVPAKQVPAT